MTLFSLYQKQILQVIAAWLAILVFALWTYQASAQSVLPPVSAPGVIASTDQVEVCGIVNGLTYSKRHRQTSQELKAAVRKRDNAVSCGEIDHRVPLALGGADVLDNLWCQSGPEFKLKDALETNVWKQVCHAHSMALTEAQAVFLAPDWQVEKCKVMGCSP